MLTGIGHLLQANDLIRKEGTSTGTDRLNPIAPFSNTIWSPGRFEGNCTRLGDGWHESRFTVTRKSRHACLSEPMGAEHWRYGNRRAWIKDAGGPRIIWPRLRLGARAGSSHNRYYYELLGRLLRFLVEPQKKVLSVRCGTGNLLAAVKPSDGKGIDILRRDSGNRAATKSVL